MAGTTEKDKALIKQYLTESGSFDNSGTPVMADNYFDAIVDLKEVCDSLGGDTHEEVTLASDDTTQETLSLTDQEIAVSLVTTTTDGVMSSADKVKLDGIEAGAEVNPEFKTIDGISIIGSGNIVTSGSTQIQADWDQSDDLELDYIKNKPSVPNSLDDLTGTLDDIDDGATYVKSENNFTDVLKDKLDNIQSGAEVNVQSDWNAVSGDAFILNKPTIPTPSAYSSVATVVSDINVSAGGGNQTIFNFTIPANALCLVDAQIYIASLNTSDEPRIWVSLQSDTSDITKQWVSRVINVSESDYYLSKTLVINNLGNGLTLPYRFRVEPPAGSSFDVKAGSSALIYKLA